MEVYNLIVYRFDRFLLTQSEDEATSSKADIASIDNVKSFKYKAKLMGNTEVDGANAILRNLTAVPSKYLLEITWNTIY